MNKIAILAKRTAEQLGWHLLFAAAAASVSFVGARVSTPESGMWVWLTWAVVTFVGLVSGGRLVAWAWMVLRTDSRGKLDLLDIIAVPREQGSMQLKLSMLNTATHRINVEIAPQTIALVQGGAAYYWNSERTKRLRVTANPGDEWFFEPEPITFPLNLKGSFNIAIKCKLTYWTSWRDRHSVTVSRYSHCVILDGELHSHSGRWNDMPGLITEML